MTHPTPTAPTRAEIDLDLLIYDLKTWSVELDQMGLLDRLRDLVYVIRDKVEEIKSADFNTLIEAAKSGEPSGDDKWCSEDSAEVLRARAMGFKVKVGKHKSVWFEDDLGRMSEQAFWSQREFVFYMNGFDAAKSGGARFTRDELIDRLYNVTGVTSIARKVIDALIELGVVECKS